MELTLVRDDLFGIAARLKSVDDGYEIYWNGETRRYELHHTACRPTRQLDLPYRQLDARTLRFVRETRAENAAALAAQIDRDNAARERALHRKAVERAWVALDRSMIEQTRIRGRGSPYPDGEENK